MAIWWSDITDTFPVNQELMKLVSVLPLALLWLYRSLTLGWLWRNRKIVTIQAQEKLMKCLF